MPAALRRTGHPPWTSAPMGMWIPQYSGSCTQILHQGKGAASGEEGMRVRALGTNPAHMGSTNTSPNWNKCKHTLSGYSHLHTPPG